MSRTVRIASTAAALAAALLSLAGCATNASPVDERDELLASAMLDANERLAVGAAFEAQGNLFAARREYRAAIVRARDSGADTDAVAGVRAVALTNLANTHVAEGHREKAKWLYRQALVVDPTYGVALNNLAMTYLDDARPTEAIDLLCRAIAVDPKNRAHYLTSLAQAYRQQGHLAVASALLHEVLASPHAGHDLVHEAMTELAYVQPGKRNRASVPLP